MKGKILRIFVLFMLFIPCLLITACDNSKYHIYLPIESIEGVDTITCVSSMGEQNCAVKGEDVGIRIKTLPGYENDDIVVYANKKVLTTYETNELGGQVREYIFYIKGIKSNMEITIAGDMKKMEYSLAISQDNVGIEYTIEPNFDVVYSRNNIMTKMNVNPLKFTDLSNMLNKNNWQYGDLIKIIGWSADYSCVIDDLIDLSQLYNNVGIAKNFEVVSKGDNEYVKTIYSISLYGDAELTINKDNIFNNINVSLYLDDEKILCDAKVCSTDNIDTTLSSYSEIKANEYKLVILIDTSSSKTMKDCLIKLLDKFTINNELIDSSNIGFVGDKLVIHVKLPYKYDEVKAKDYEIRVQGAKEVVKSGYVELSIPESNTEIRINNFLLFNKYMLESEDVKYVIAKPAELGDNYKINIDSISISVSDGIIVDSVAGYDIDIVDNNINLTIASSCIAKNGFPCLINIEN